MTNLRFINLLLAAVCILLTFQSVNAQKMDRIEKDRMKDILKNIKNTIEKNYYDSNFSSMDLDSRFKTAEERLKTAETLGQALGIIAQAVIDINDSHTRFAPPPTNIIVDYGWKMKMFGDKCFVTKVKEKSDAQSKGLKV